MTAVGSVKNTVAIYSDISEILEEYKKPHLELWGGVVPMFHKLPVMPICQAYRLT